MDSTSRGPLRPVRPPTFRRGAKLVPQPAASGQDPLAGMPMFRAPAPTFAGELLHRIRSWGLRELGFIMAGAGVLIMAPLIEHWMFRTERAVSASGPEFSRRGP